MGWEKMNQNGEVLLDYTYKNNMKIVGAFFNKRDERKRTLISSNRLVQNEIHHLLINDRKIRKDATVLSKFKFSSGHRIFRAIIGMRLD